MPATFTEVLPASKAHAHRAVRYTPAGKGRGELTVTDTRTHTVYSCVEIATGPGFPGRAVVLTKRCGERYAVRVGTHPRDVSCDCAGFVYGRGMRLCKHVEALRGLLANGWLDVDLDRGDEGEVIEDRGETAEEAG